MKKVLRSESSDAFLKLLPLFSSTKLPELVHEPPLFSSILQPSQCSYTVATFTGLQPALLQPSTSSAAAFSQLCCSLQPALLQPSATASSSAAASSPTAACSSLWLSSNLQLCSGLDLYWLLCPCTDLNFFCKSAAKS